MWHGQVMTYRVVSTQTYSDPISEWSHEAEFDREDDAQAFAVIHYETQTRSEENYNPATDCLCETCSGGWRAYDWKALAVQVVKI
jgi:hypothetical protein